MKALVIAGGFGIRLGRLATGAANEARDAGGLYLPSEWGGLLAF